MYLSTMNIATLSGPPVVNELIEIGYMDGEKVQAHVVQSLREGILATSEDGDRIFLVPWSNVSYILFLSRGEELCSSS
jgi:hypothetical protein